MKTHENSSAHLPYRNVFEKYFSEMLHDHQTRIAESFPYISISRDFGCMANVIAQKLSAHLTLENKRKGINREWKWINKVIMEEAAKALELSPSKIEYVFQSQKKTVMDEIVSAMSTRYYKSDKKIRKTIIEVIRSIIISGNVIIVGRGGVAFRKDNPDSLHIKLIAPIEWRVDRICKNYQKTPKEALKYILEIDQERKYLIDSFVGFDTDDSIFDMVFNRQTMNDDEIIAIIIQTMAKRKLI
jgi:cytidylate kinase